jgi:hypothetical protein
MHHQDQDTRIYQTKSHESKCITKTKIRPRDKHPKKNPPIPSPQRATSFLPSSQKNKRRGKENKGRKRYTSLEPTGNKSSTSCSPTTGMNSCVRAMEKHKGAGAAKDEGRELIERRSYVQAKAAGAGVALP